MLFLLVPTGVARPAAGCASILGTEVLLPMEIELREIHKNYGAVHANCGISLRVAPGTVHGILGENGAGKSTLMKILAGYTTRTSGTILFDGRPTLYHTPTDAMRLGVGMLYQDPLDFPALTVLENFMLGQADGLFRSRTEFARQLQELAGRLHFQLNPHFYLEKLTFGERQQLELLRLLVLGVEVLILDEPTTGISSVQKEILFEVLRKLAAQGKSLLLVSHKLEDVEALCDRVTVLRQGKVAGEMDAPFDTPRLLELMFGSLPAPPPRCSAARGGPLLSFEAVSATGGRAGLRDCSVSIQQGEVVGLAGLEGSGQGVFLRLAAGLQQPMHGTIRLQDRNMANKDHLAFRRAGVTFLPASRLEEGLIPGLTLMEHFALSLRRRHFVIPWKEIAQRAQSRIERFRIRGRVDSPVEALSGGNQQRLLLSLMPRSPDVLLLEQPTHGLDMESSHWFWKYLQSLCDHGTTIVFSSAELDEILMVSHRVLVFYNGALILDETSENTDPDVLGKAIAGKI